MNILVYEHVTGGGVAGAAFPQDLAAEGYAMLGVALRGFMGLPGYRITVLHDARLRGDAFLAHRRIPVEPGRLRPRFVEAVGGADAVLIIAPETGGILAALTAAVEAAGKPVLGAPAAAVQEAGDKLRASRALAAAGVRVPGTVGGLSSDSPIVWLPYPIVVKPKLGAGGEGISLVRHACRLGEAVARAQAVGGRAGCLAQEYIPGLPASVSLLSDGRRARPLTLNRQFIGGGTGFSYVGGEVPCDHPQHDAAFEVAARACAAIRGLKGYVGVDMILADDGPVVIEVNARWTTSCVGIERTTDVNLSAAVLDAVLCGVLPERLRISGRARFDLQELRAQAARAARPCRDG